MASIWLLVTLFCGSVLGIGPDQDCTAFKTDGSASSVYQFYRFYDFRHLLDSWSFTTPPENTGGHPSMKSVNDSTWTLDWYLRDYPRTSDQAPKIPVNFVSSRVQITSNPDTPSGSYLTLSTARLVEDSQEGAEITFQELNISYASARIYARVAGNLGAVASLFTYYDDNTESDIEIITKNTPHQILYSNQPSYDRDTPIDGTSTLTSLPGNRVWTDWHVHRLDWVPGKTVFFIDNIQVAQLTVNVPKPEPASRLYLDMWGANSSTSGSMPVGGKASFDIQWIELLFNQSVNIAAPPEPSPYKLCTVGIGGLPASTSVVGGGALTGRPVAPKKTSKSTKVVPSVLWSLSFLWLR